jgi:uncharacterized membrane protein
MEKMLAVVFDSEPKAYEGTKALKQLDYEGNVDVHALSVIKKNANGTVEPMKTEGDFPIRTVAGTAIGSFIGLLGGPLGVAVGAAAGTMLGVSSDLYRSGVDADFVDEVSGKLAPGKFAVVADMSEDWVTPLDTRMGELGGQVFRTTRHDVELEQLESDMAALDAENAQLDKEMKQARGEQKAKLQAKIDKLKEKRQNKVEQAKQRLDQIQAEHEAKVQALERKAAKAHGEAKAAIEARVTEVREGHRQTVAKWKNSEAKTLEDLAQRLETRARTLKSEKK